MELSPFALPYSDLLHVENCLWVLAAPTGNANYDFRLDSYFRCRHPWESPSEVVAVARIGAIAHYDKTYASLLSDGVRLVHDSQQYLHASELPYWYPLVEDLTPESRWFEARPDVSEIADLGWPVFVKGTRQTSRHRRSLSIIEGPEHFQRAMEAYQSDPILRSQRVVCREFVPLRLVEEEAPDRLPAAFEFRTFWWRGEFVGCGRYWWEGHNYRMTAQEESTALALAKEAAMRVAVPFLVVDVAQAADGRWLVIECNDGQESGYGGVSPIALWQRVFELERRRNA